MISCRGWINLSQKKFSDFCDMFHISVFYAENVRFCAMEQLWRLINLGLNFLDLWNFVIFKNFVWSCILEIIRDLPLWHHWYKMDLSKMLQKLHFSVKWHFRATVFYRPNKGSPWILFYLLSMYHTTITKNTRCLGISFLEKFISKLVNLFDENGENCIFWLFQLNVTS